MYSHQIIYITTTNENKEENKTPKITYPSTISVANVTLKITYTHPDTMQKFVFVPLFKLNYVCAKLYFLF
jgi:hypothetical protein